MKKCSKCKEVKLLSLFYANKKSRDGYSSWCRGCTNSRNADKIIRHKYNQNYLHKLNFGNNREQAIQRDGEKCVQCGMTREEHKIRYGRDITVDHINGKGRNETRKEKDNRLENLQTLCLSCHGKKDILRSSKLQLERERMALYSRINH